jgi:hypothetical protein
MCDRQTVIFCFIKNINGIKKHEQILKELLKVSFDCGNILHLAEFCVVFYDKKNPACPT